MNGDLYITWNVKVKSGLSSNYDKLYAPSDHLVWMKKIYILGEHHYNFHSAARPRICWSSSVQHGFFEPTGGNNYIRSQLLSLSDVQIILKMSMKPSIWQMLIKVQSNTLTSLCKISCACECFISILTVLTQSLPNWILIT